MRGGERVVLHWRKGIGIESPTPLYQWQNRTLNAGRITTFNEYAIVSENRLTPITTNISAESMSLYGCALPTGFGSVTNDAKLTIGESLLVFGIGGVGHPFY